MTTYIVSYCKIIFFPTLKFKKVDFDKQLLIDPLDIDQFYNKNFSNSVLTFDAIIISTRKIEVIKSLDTHPV